VSALPEEAAALFREEPESFVSRRDALVKELRAAGRDDDAAAVKALRKPNVAAWALNGLAAADPEGVEALLAAGAELRSSQQAALSSGTHADRLRDATTARREAVARLRAVAADRLAGSGRTGGGHLDAIGAALETVSVDEDAGARLRAGTFERPPDAPAGFGDVFGLTAVDGGGAAPSRARSRAAETAAARTSMAAELRRNRDAAVTRAGKARETADRLARQLRDLEERTAAMQTKHADAESSASAAELEARRAERALSTATDRAPR
jgi:hypothetical protein